MSPVGVKAFLLFGWWRECYRMMRVRVCQNEYEHAPSIIVPAFKTNYNSNLQNDHIKAFNLIQC